MINNIKTFITDNQKDIKYIFALTIFLLIISIPKILAQYHVGIGNWDTYLYLENGRNFAKMGWGDVPSIAPIIPITLSKLFLLAGHPYQEAIFNIDVIFYILGIVSFYLLLRIRFNENMSILGSVILSTFTLLYSWVAIGGNDIIGVTGTILAVYLFIISHKYDNRFYLLAFPIAAYAFLSRYTAGVMIFTIIFYLVISKIRFKEIKYVILGGILGVISISWFLNNFNKHLGTPFPFLGQFSGTVSNTVVLDSGFLPDSWYYIKHIPNYLISYVPNVDTFNALVNPMGNVPSIFSYMYILLFILGLAFIVYRVYNIVKSKDYELNNIRKLLICVSLLLFVVFLFTLGLISYIISSIMFLIVLYIIWKVFEPYEIKYFDYELVMISLFVTYLIFQSILFTKNDRYFITVLPFIAFFITYALDSLFTHIRKINNGIKVQNILIIIVILGLLANTLLFVGGIPSQNEYADIEDACSWLDDNRIINNSTFIHSDNWPAVTWYLNVYGQRGVINTSNVSERIRFANEILSYSKHHMPSSYFIDTTSSEKYDYPGLTLIKVVGNVGIYENNYVKYGTEYLKSDEYNSRIKDEIEEFNRTSGSNV